MREFIELVFKAAIEIAVIGGIMIVTVMFTMVMAAAAFAATGSWLAGLVAGCIALVATLAIGVTVLDHMPS